MAARNTNDSRRFVHRSANNDSERYFVPVSSTASWTSQPEDVQRPTVVRSADSVTPRNDVNAPARRVVVIRNTRNPQVNQEPSDLNEFARANPPENAPVFTDGNKSVFLIRRPVVPPDSTRVTDPLEDLHTPTPPPPEMTTSPDPPRSPSPPQRVPSPVRPPTTKRYAPYLRRTQSKVQTPSPPTETLRPPTRNRVKSTKTRPPSPPKQEVVVQEEVVLPPQPLPPPKETDRKRSFLSFLSRKSSPESNIIEKKEETVQYSSISSTKPSPRKKSSITRTKSAKSVVFVHPDDQSIVVVENSFVKGEPVKPIIKRPKSQKKKTRFQLETDDSSTEHLVQVPRSQRCLNCLSRCMCLVILICLILLLIGLAGAAVSAYFLATDSSTNLIPKIVGLAVAAVLIIAAFCFLYIVLGCIGSRDGYFSYNDDDEQHIGGRAFALIPPSHPNAHLYIPREYMRMVENSHPPPPPTLPLTKGNSNMIYTQAIPPIRPQPQPQPTVHRTNTTMSVNESKATKSNITIEMDERLVNERTISPKSRERNLNKVVKNVGQIVEDAKKRYHGDLPNKVIVRVDQNTT